MKDTEICNYVDDTTIFAYSSYMCSILKSHEQDVSLLPLGFENNYMKVNEGKSHLLVFGSNDEEVSVSISGSLMQESDEEKLLEVTLKITLSFKISLLIFERSLAESYMHWQRCHNI